MIPPLFGKQEVGIWRVQKTLPTIWHTYMKLVTKYQIPVINCSLYLCRLFLLSNNWTWCTIMSIKRSHVQVNVMCTWNSKCQPRMIYCNCILNNIMIGVYLYSLCPSRIPCPYNTWTLGIKFQSNLNWWTLQQILSVNKMNCELMFTYDTPALRQTGSRNLTGPKNASHNMAFLYTLNIYAHFSQQLLMAEIWYLVTSFI
jgi:hypothetical protein